MANYTSLAIGINRYQYIQPLSYAQQDAQALHQLLVEETELPPEQALMLTDASPWIQNHATEPSRANLHYWLTEWLPHQQTDLLWFFFSGYGVSWQEEDYLMPIDGNPNDIPGTAVHLPSLVRQIQQAGFAQVLMLLDINRSPGVIAGQSVGGQIAELAPEQGVSLILSSQMDEASHEHGALGHGMFTAALLEGLRYYAGPQLTLDRLSHYLYERLPELSEHHWRPVQHPLIVIPSIELAEAPLLPHRNARTMAGSGAGSATAPLPTAIAPNNHSPSSNSPSAITIASSTVTEVETPEDDPDALPPELLPEPLDLPEAEVTASSAAIATPAADLTNLDGEGPEPSLPPFGATPPPRGFAEALKSPATPVAPVPADPPNPPPPLKPPTVPPPAPQRRTTGNLTPKQKSWQLWGSLTLLILALLGLLNLFRGRQNNPVVDVPPATDNAETDADNSDAIADAPTADAGEAEPSPPAPTTERDPVVGPTTLAESQAILAQARTYIQTNQASGFSRAIAEATKIPPRAPLYDEAQADIARWSEVILDIARGRANQGDFKGAIAAAQLIPTAQATVYQNAQQQIGQWQTQQRNVELIRTARRQIRHPQASSYNQAINTVRQIASGQPGYSQAQELIKVWSEQIYLIANSRAAREEYQQAITTAQLVPEGTPSYDRAQQAIARWQQNKP